MSDIILKIIFVILETVLYLGCLHMVLPKKYREDLKDNAVLLGLMILPGMFLLKDGLLYVLTYNILFILAIKIYFKISLNVSALAVAMVYALNMLVSLMTTIFVLFSFNEIIDFRYIVSNYSIVYFLIKFIVMSFVLTLYRRLQFLFNKKVHLENASPQLPLLINGIYYFSLIFLSCSIISYFPVVYSQIIKINYLKEIIASSIIVFYTLSFLILYYVNKVLLSQNSFKYIKYKSERDELTKIYNRATGMQMLKEKMNLVIQSKGVMTVCFIDINNLKVVNDKFGHAEGDKLITSFSNIVSNSLRGNDIFFRYGGDEFIVVFDSCSFQSTVNVWSRMEKKFRDFNIQNYEKFNISVSAGFEEYNAKSNKTIQELIETADKKMYHNKQEFKRLKGYKNARVNGGVS